MEKTCFVWAHEDLGWLGRVCHIFCPPLAPHCASLAGLVTHIPCLIVRREVDPSDEVDINRDLLPYVGTDRGLKLV